MTDAERIEQLEGELSAAVFGGADTIATLLRAMIPTSDGRAEAAEKLRMMSGQATWNAQLQRADILWMAAEMVERE